MKIKTLKNTVIGLAALIALPSAVFAGTYTIDNKLPVNAIANQHMWHESVPAGERRTYTAAWAPFPGTLPYIEVMSKPYAKFAMQIRWGQDQHDTVTTLTGGENCKPGDTFTVTAHKEDQTDSSGNEDKKIEGVSCPD